jgi:hypothetical protein
MRLPASEKLEVIGLVEQSHLPARRTLQMLGIQPSTFYRWYDRFGPVPIAIPTGKGREHVVDRVEKHSAVPGDQSGITGQFSFLVNIIVNINYDP